MLELNRQLQTLASQQLSTSIAHGEAEVMEAQRLSYKAFAEETGVNLPGEKEEIDSDFFDPYCQYLLARETTENKN